MNNHKALAGVLLTLTLLVGCDSVIPASSKGVCISGYNQNARHIHEFWLDNESKAGCHGNPPGPDEDQIYGGGGKFTCGCRVTPGKQVKLEWEFVQTLAEFKAKLPSESHEANVVIPQPESSSSRYFRVYFMKDGSTALQWVDDMGAPVLPPPTERMSE